MRGTTFQAPVRGGVVSPGSLLDRPVFAEETPIDIYTNMRAAHGRYCFRKNVKWHVAIEASREAALKERRWWTVQELIAARERGTKQSTLC